MQSPTSSEVEASVDEAPPSPASIGAELVDSAANGTAGQWRLVRRWAIAGYVVASLFQYRYGMPWSSPGLPLEREQLIGWFLVGSVVWSLGRDRREVLYAVVGWGVLGLCLVLYDFTRGAIDNLWGYDTPIPGRGGEVPAQAVHNADRILTAERALFFGFVPTEWLQDRFYQPGRSGPRWEVLTALTYLSHFIVVYLVALIQWVRDRSQWVKWVRALATLIVLGVTGYFLFPTAPPWLAGRFGLMRTVERPGTRGLRHINLEIADRAWNKGKGSINIVAAMPSLHFAFTTLVLFFFWRTAKPWLRVILVAYPIVMLFTLAYGGEHYVLDCVVGAALAWFAVWVNRRFDTWRGARHSSV